MMKKKFFILFLTLIFSLSITGLPLNVNSCTMINGESGCGKCINDLKDECSSHKQEVINNRKDDCCVKTAINNGVKEEFLAQSSAKDRQKTGSFILFSSSIADNFTRIPGALVNQSPGSVVISNKLYLYNSALLI